MAMLNPEINRFLGHALLDPDLLKCLFSPERARALKQFNLRPEERATILASPARNLPDLSRELAAAFAQPDRADADADVERLTQSLQASGKTTGGHIQNVIHRAINSVPPPRAVDARLANEDYVRLIAS
jgi:hypothetical protein